MAHGLILESKPRQGQVPKMYSALFSPTPTVVSFLLLTFAVVVVVVTERILEQF